MPTALRFLSACALIPLLASAQNANLSSSKRGVVYVHTENSADDHYWSSSESDLTWYYNYVSTPNNSLDNSGLQFVPMLWSADDNSFYNTVKGLIDNKMNITYALGFNEPDGCTNGGSCVDAETAAQVWISQMEPLKELGVKLGAPAVTGATTGFNWLQNWFTACNGGCTVDFIPVHWYGSFEGLASHIGQVNATYPNISSIWVTEFNDPNQDLSDTQSFYNQSISFLDRVSYIERYSLFGSFRSSVSNVGPNGAMLTQNGQLTDIGAWYLGRSATGNIPKGDAAQTATLAGWAMALVAASMCWLA